MNPEANQEAQVETLELNIKDAERFVKDQEALERLEKNRDFKRVFSELFLKEHAINLVHMRNRVSREQVADIDRSMDAISEFITFCQGVRFRGRQAQMSIDDSREEIEDIENGEAAGDWEA